jgi:broad specificity phosphatase PhoE
MQVSLLRRLWSALAVLMTAAMLAGCGGTSKSDAHNITLTFVRHGQSEANAGDVASTIVPGPPLTAAGQDQADKLATELSANQYDGVYASQLLRTQQAAAPMAKALGQQVTVLPGLNEISAGWFEGWSMKDTSGTYMLGPQNWLKGDRRFGIPGSVNGNEFNEAFTAAVQTIYDSGQEKPIAFSSGFAIMMWTLMNARNGNPSLLTDHPLPNASRVVLTGNPTTGWTLQEWDGITNFTTAAA